MIEPLSDDFLNELLEHNPVEDEFWANLLAEESTTTRRASVSSVEGFYGAAVFLLGLNYTNLFDPAPKSVWWFVCKGCGERVKRIDRQDHHRKHREEFKLQ